MHHGHRVATRRRCGGWCRCHAGRAVPRLGARALTHAGRRIQDLAARACRQLHENGRRLRNRTHIILDGRAGRILRHLSGIGAAVDGRIADLRRRLDGDVGVFRLLKPSRGHLCHCSVLLDDTQRWLAEVLAVTRAEATILLPSRGQRSLLHLSRDRVYLSMCDFTN